MSADDGPRPDVLVSNRQDIPVDESGLRALAEDTLVAEGANEVELSLTFVSLEDMRDLHERFMREHGPTDVLAFPMDDGDGARRLLGDVVVCPEYAASSNDDLASELRLLVVHGVLHLLGYDHEEDDERELMWRRQERYSGVAV